jgi:hypothetical protein
VGSAVADPRCNERVRQYNQSTHELFSNIAVERPRESLSSQSNSVRKASRVIFQPFIKNFSLPELDQAMLQQTDNLAEELTSILEAAGGFSNVQFTF